MICAVEPKNNHEAVPHFGYGGPRDGQIPALPLAYLPRALDNSSGGQTFVSSDSFGPLSDQLLHFSFGMGSHFLVLRDEVDGQVQGAVVPLAGEFRSGVHRGRIHPTDGQLYVTGMQGWASYTPDDGCFHRLRFSGENVQVPTGFHVHENGIAITFSLPLEESVAASRNSHFAQCWNYRYGPGYGSAEFSTKHVGMRGHDTLLISSAQVLPDGHTLFIELPEIQPVNQLHLRVQSSPNQFHELFVTVHKLDEPFAGVPGYLPTHKHIDPHPMLADLAMATRSVPNPHTTKLDRPRPITIETGTNLSYATRAFRVSAGEPIALTLSNPDVVPHNWALAKPGTMDRVGELADRSISDPNAALRHFVPSTTDVIAYTNVVMPREEFTIYFHAPRQPGRYPYLCTFPGHWKVMNGVMIVE
jgi:azurin